MNFKYLTLFILFVFNFSATVLADSSHVDMPSVTHCHEHKDHLSKHDAAADDSTNHCTNHNCHQGHVHYYLMPVTLYKLSSLSSIYTFPSYSRSFSVNQPEIIKPPLI